MQDQQHRVTAIAAADGYELFDATNANRLVPLDALRRDDTTQVTDDARGLRAREGVLRFLCVNRERQTRDSERQPMKLGFLCHAPDDAIRRMEK